jgi:putative redox protein
LVRIEVRYEGSLRCRATHVPSGVELRTDAPVDNLGKGESFSPTDLTATSLGACILTTMAIVAERHGWDLSQATVSVEKSMIADPQRRIARLETCVRVPADLDSKARIALERAAHTCPVHESLDARIEAPIRFEWGPTGS